MHFSPSPVAASAHSALGRRARGAARACLARARRTSLLRAATGPGPAAAAAWPRGLQWARLPELGGRDTPAAPGRGRRQVALAGPRPPAGPGPGQLSAGWPASAWAPFNVTIFLHRTRLPRQASGMPVSNIQLRPQSASVSRATSEGACRAASRLYDRSLPVACARAPARALRHAPKE